MMERALKERIIGAVVLVVFVVLVVPVFLDGPPQDGEVVTERVLLPGQDADDTRTVILNNDRTEPVPTSSGEETREQQPPPARPETTPVQETQQPVARTEPDPEQTPSKPAPQPVEQPQTQDQPATSSTGMWAVQLGSFSNKENAEKLAADLRRQGYTAFVSQHQTGSGVLHRVRIGPQKDRAGAEQMAARLLKVDIKGQVVPHP